MLLVIGNHVQRVRAGGGAVMKRGRDNPFIIPVRKTSERYPSSRHRATHMLIHTQLSYAEIAKACGYEFPETIEAIARDNFLREFGSSRHPWGKHLRTLTVMNPFAELIRRKIKRVENRDLPIWKYRMELIPSPKFPSIVLLHAGSGFGKWTDEYGIRREECAWGAATCLMQIVGSPHKSEIPKWVETNGPEKYGWLLTHEHAQGKFCWIIEDVVPLLRPVKLRGNQGIWDAAAEAINPAAPLCPEHGVPFCRCPKLKEILGNAGVCL